MIIWLAISTPIILIFLVLLMNQANLTQAPGIKHRLKLFLQTNTAEISSEPVLPELKAPVFDLSPDQLFEQILSAARAFGWEIKHSDATSHTLHLVVTTGLWKFKDDIRVTVVKQDNGSSLHAVSQSRLGRGDFAANSHHLQQLLNQLTGSRSGLK